VGRLLLQDGRSPSERERFVRLVSLFAQLPIPPDPHGLYPHYGELKERLLSCALDGDDGDDLEEAFLSLYCHVHGHEAPYTPQERQRVDRTGGYWCHAGGISPILKAAPHIHRHTVSADYGAGNGLQALLMQWLYPHLRTVQIEISSRMVDAGRHLQRWLGIADGRVQWRVADVCEVLPRGMGFIYLYRPVRPEGEGRRFYEMLASELAQTRHEVVIFSVADCLRSFLPPQLEVFYSDGHLTCYRRAK
jgi:hypothetical protein